jgi:hypothetical protein
MSINEFGIISFSKKSVDDFIPLASLMITYGDVITSVVPPTKYKRE